MEFPVGGARLVGLALGRCGLDHVVMANESLNFPAEDHHHRETISLVSLSYYILDNSQGLWSASLFSTSYTVQSSHIRSRLRAPVQDFRSGDGTEWNHEILWSEGYESTT